MRSRSEKQNRKRNTRARARAQREKKEEMKYHKMNEFGNERSKGYHDNNGRKIPVDVGLIKKGTKKDEDITK